MSLINQMLKDLDKRAPAQAPAEKGLLSDVAPATNRRRRPGPLRLGLLVLLLVGASVAWWKSAGPIGQPEAAKIPAAVPEAAAAVMTAPPRTTEPPPAPVNRTPDEAVESRPVVVEKRPAALESLYLAQVDNQLRVSAAFSHMPAYRLIRQDQGKQLALELPAGTKVASLPDTETPPLLQKLAHETADGRVRLVFSFEQPCRSDEMRVMDNPNGEGRTLQFVIRPEPSDIRQAEAPAVASATEPSAAPPVTPAVAEPAPAPQAEPPAAKEFVRQVVRPTAHQQAEDLYQSGMAAFRKGHLRKAEQALRQTLAIAPDHIGARDALLLLLERQNLPDQVNAVLAEGVKNAPGHLPYRVRLVHRLIEAGDLSGARKELTREPLPSAADAPDLYAMLASVNLRQGRYREAADTYHALLAVNPGKAVWWMGLGIALEGDAALDQARQAYGKALTHEGLSDGLRQFIRKRLAASQGGQTGKPSTGKTPHEERS